MSSGKIQAIALLLCISITSTAITPEQLQLYYSNLNKELAKALTLADEHPQNAVIICESSLADATKLNNDHLTLLTYFILSKANQNMGNSERAIQFADSAMRLVYELNTPELLPNIVKVKAEVLARNGKGKESLSIAAEAMNSAKKVKANKLLVEFTLLQSHIYGQLNNTDDIQPTIKKAIDIASKERDEPLLAECFRSMGSYFFRLSQFEQSLEWYDKAKQIYALLPDTLGLIAILKNSSLAFRDMGKFPEAKSSLDNALQLAYSTNDEKNMADIYNLLGSLSLRSKKNAEALEYYNRSLTIREKEGYLVSTATTLENITKAQRELNQYDDASINLLKAIEIRITLNDSRGLASAYNEMGNLFSEKGDLAEALKYYLKSLKISQEANFQNEKARAINNIGITYRKLGSHRNALKYFDQALELMSDKSDPLGKAYVYIHHGNTLLDMGIPDKALESFFKAYELRRTTNNPISISQSYRSIATAYMELNSFEQARSYLNKAHSKLEEAGDEIGVADILNELGNLYLKTNDYDKAISHFQQAALLYGKHFLLDKRGLCLRKIGEIQTKLGDYTKASENLKLALSLGESTKNEKLVELTLLALHDFHLARGEHREALEYFKQHLQVKDKFEKKNMDESIWQASLELELDKKAEEIKKIEGEVETLRTEAKLKTIELRQQKLQRNFLAIITILVIVLATVSIYGYTAIRNKNRWLNEANEKLLASELELKKMVNTKDKLFSIIAHDLRSPFSGLVGLTELMMQNASTLDTQTISKYSSLVHQSAQKLLNLIENLLHWSRKQSGNIRIEPTSILLKRICDDVLNVQKLQADAKSIELKSSIEEGLNVFADYDTLSTVLRNLVSNAIKFSHSESVVNINGYKRDDQIIIQVIDKGIGISPENQSKLFKLEESFSTQGTNREEGTGLGLIVCQEYVELNKGNISVESNANDGTTFTISLPSA